MSKIVPPFLRTPFNYDRDLASDESGLKCEDPSLAVQDSRDEVDINTIVKRFGLTGELPDQVVPPQYGDFTGVFDFQTAMNAVRRAGESFMKLPAAVRSRFHNDPQEYLEFFADPKNQDEAIALGLAERAPEGVEGIVPKGGTSPIPAKQPEAAAAAAGAPGPSGGPVSPKPGGQGEHS